MRLVERPRVQHRDAAAADDVAVGAAEGEGGGVVAEHPADQRRDLLDSAVGEWVVTQEGNGHQRSPVSARCRRSLSRLRMARPAPTINTAPMIMAGPGTSPQTSQPSSAAQSRPE